jgi:hypothetical protein
VVKQIKIRKDSRSEVLTAASSMLAVFWVVAPGSRWNPEDSSLVMKKTFLHVQEHTEKEKVL